jgi:sigma-B regulation protein RsbU (phosphoserine phosphatase)
LIQNHAIPDELPCGVVSVVDGKIGYANDFLCTLLGYENAELEQQQLEKLFTVSTRIFFQTHFFPLLKLGQVVEEVFLSLLSKEGQHIPVLAAGRQAGNDFYLVFATVRNRKKYEDEILTARKVAEEALEKNEMLQQLRTEAEFRLAESERQLAMLRRFNSEYVELNKIISHDLHEPIRKMMLHTDILLNSKEQDRKEVEYHLRKLNGFSARMRQLTGSLQEYVAIDTSGEPVTELDLNSIMTAALSASQQKFPDAEVLFSPDNLPRIEGARSQIDRLFREVFTNAIRYRKRGAPAEIKIRVTEFNDNIYKELKGKYRYVDFVRIDVEDKGRGFAPEFNEYIFGLFQKLDLETEGAGFGLSLARKIVQRHKGELNARPLPDGAVFSIILPKKQRDS